jgi:long-chain acyl-CoA synthetase
LTDLPETVPALFQRTAARRPDQPALFFKAGERWVPINWSEYSRAVNRLGNALLAEGLHPQDRVAIWSANRPEWQIADLAILHAGLTTVALYQTLAPDQVKYLLSHSESKVLIVEDATLFDQASAMRRELPALQPDPGRDRRDRGMVDQLGAGDAAGRRVRPRAARPARQSLAGGGTG